MDHGLRTTDPNRCVTPACWTLILLSTVLSVARLLHAEPLQSANDRSRWSTVLSLVELGTYQIDKVRQVPGWDTIDKVRHEGHFYSSKPPLLSTIVAGLYWFVRQTVGWTLGGDLNATTRLILLVLNIVPMTIALLLLARLVREFSVSAFTAVFIVAAAAFGTLLLPFLMSLNNHTVAAVSVVFALSPMIRILQGRATWRRFALAGFWSAMACTHELPAAAFGLAAFGVLHVRSAKKTWLAFVPAALVPLAAFFVTNYLATGGWKPFYMDYGTEKYEFIHEGVPSYWMNPRGLDADRDGFWTYLLHCTIGHHGLFSLSPIYVLTLIGWGAFLRFQISNFRFQISNSESEISNSACSPVPSAVHWMGLLLSLLVFGFYLSRTQNYNYGGVSVALRWMLWLIPFWLLAMIPALDRLLAGTRNPVSLRNRLSGWAARSLAMLALALSVFSAWYPLDGPWKQPWLFVLMEDAGWIDYSDPRPQFERPHYTWIGRIPEGEAPQPDYWIELEGPGLTGSRTVLRLEDAGPRIIDDRPARAIRITRRQHGRTIFSQVVTIDAAAFYAGKRIDEFLLPPEDPTSDADGEFAREILTGLPQPARYVVIEERHLHVPLRRDAFRTLRVYAQVTGRPEEGSGVYRYRREVWLTDELPFGVARLLTQVSGTSGVAAREQLTAVRAGLILDDAGSD